MDVDVSASNQNLQLAAAAAAEAAMNEEDDKQAKWFDLHPNRNLLDANFEGYKLSLEGFAQYKLDLAGARHTLDTYNFIDSADCKLNFVLFQHLKLFGFGNLLCANPFSPPSSGLYYVDVDHRLVKVCYALPKLKPTRAIVATNLQLDKPKDNQMRTHASIRFVSERILVVFDGCSRLYACELVDRVGLDEDQLRSEGWRVDLKWDTEETGVIRDAVLVENALHVMLVYVKEVVNGTGDKKQTNGFDTICCWLTFERSESTQWSWKRTRKLNCFSSIPDYIGINK